MTPTPEEVLATLLREVALRKQHPELGCYECGEPFDTHMMSCPVPVIEIAAAALSASQERVRELEAALKQSLALVRQWHGMGMQGETEEHMWLIYGTSPEMVLLRAALRGPSTASTRDSGADPEGGVQGELGKGIGDVGDPSGLQRGG